LGGGYAGDTETPEQQIPPTGYPGKDWETCMTINNTWGYKSFDTNFKSTEVLLRNLIDIASKGGNYLLNVGPDATGVVPGPEQDRLRQIGAWLNANGEAIYGTRASLLPDPHGAYGPALADGKGKPKWIPVWDWRSTTAKDKVYVEVFAWPKGALHLDKLPRTVTGAYLLADATHAPLKFKQTGGAVEVELPGKPLDPIATVVVLETK
jgi:alpha-L-fucosidase